MTPVNSGIRAKATKVDRTRLPDLRPSDSLRFPPIEKSVLASGLRVWTVHHASIPVLNLILLVPRGSATDPAGKEGLAALTVDLLDEGSGMRSAIQMHEALARIGAQLDSDVGPDSAQLGVGVLSRFSAQALTLLADMTARPSLRTDDFERVRDLRLKRLQQLRDFPTVVADRAFARLLYGSHPYGHTPLGSEQALLSLSVDDVQVSYRSLMNPAHATLIAVGDCDHETMHRLADTVFAGWPGTAPAPEPAMADLPKSKGLYVMARPGAPQSELRMGHVAASRDTPDYHALVAANMVLGGPFVSRINVNLRDEKGLTYGARSSIDFRRQRGPFVMQTAVATRATGIAVRELLTELTGVRGIKPLTTEELTLATAGLTRGYARSFETAEQIARAATQIALYGLPDTYYDDFVPTIVRLTPDDVTSAAARYLDPDRVTTLIVGDVDAIADDISSLNLGDPIVLPPDAF